MLAVVSLAKAGSVIENFEDLTVKEICDLLPESSSILRPNTCNYWVRCPRTNANLEEGVCAAGLYYDKNVGRCVAMEDVVCPYTESAVSNICADERDGTFHADATAITCHGYILCKAGKEVKATCPNNLLFNPKTGSCVYPNQYACPTTIHRTTSPVCRSLANNTHLANDKECNKYYICANEILYNRTCDAQMAYDVSLGRCVPATNATCYATAQLPPPESTLCLGADGKPLVGHLVDEESCSHYYVCKNTGTNKHDTNPKRYQCTQGLYYDYKELSCRDRLNVRCSLDRCADTSMTYVNVFGDCQSYARCSGGVAVGSGRCPPNYFFDERNQGCTPVNHNFTACAA